MNLPLTFFRKNIITQYFALLKSLDHNSLIIPVSFVYCLCDNGIWGKLVVTLFSAILQIPLKKIRYTLTSKLEVELYLPLSMISGTAFSRRLGE